MSNVTTGEIVNLVAAAYGIKPAAILKQPHGVQVSATGREARALVFFLGAKHTPWTPARYSITWAYLIAVASCIGWPWLGKQSPHVYPTTPPLQLWWRGWNRA